MLDRLQERSAVAAKTGADVLLAELIHQQVATVFGYPGGAILPISDSMARSGFDSILVRHEQGAVHAAEGFAKSTGQPGVVFVTSGPGAANCITGIADAKADSIPLVFFTGQVTSSAIGTNAFQEIDVVAITMPITKRTFQVHRTADLVSVVREAFTIAMSGRKGPVVIDLPKDVMAGVADHQCRTESVPRIETNGRIATGEIQLLTRALTHAKRPVLLMGGGVVASGGEALARKVAAKLQIPVVTSLLGLGILAPTDSNNLGMAGMHGNYAANMALSECDCLINIGCRFDDRLVTKPAEFAPRAWKAHFDIDPHELNKIIDVDLSAVVDAQTILQQLLDADIAAPSIAEWQQQLAAWQARYPYHYQPAPGVIKPQAVIEEVGRLTNGDAIVVTDVGQHQMWVAQYYPFRHANQLITSGGLGTMGFGLPAALGAKLAHPDRQVVLFVGDGGFQMTVEELAVIQQYQIDIKIVILNNQALGMVRQWQDWFYQKRRFHTTFDTQPDFKTIATAYELQSITLAPSDWRSTLADVFATHHCTLAEVPIAQSEEVTPMIAPGASNHEMIKFE